MWKGGRKLESERKIVKRKLKKWRELAKRKEIEEGLIKDNVEGREKIEEREKVSSEKKQRREGIRV